jgi:hypothetical protein
MLLLVVHRGNPIYDDIMSAIVHLSAVRSALTLDVCFNNYDQYIGISRAFLCGHLSKPLCMTLPKGLVERSRKICKVKKSIMDLEKAPRSLHKHLHGGNCVCLTSSLERTLNAFLNESLTHNTHLNSRACLCW